MNISGLPQITSNKAKRPRYMNTTSFIEKLGIIRQRAGQFYDLPGWYAIDIVFLNFLYLWPNSTIRIKLWMSNEQYHILSYKNWFIIMRTSIMDFGKRDFLNWIISATTPLKIRQTISYLQVWKVKYTFQNQPFVGPVTGLIYSRCRIAGLRLVCPMYTLPSGKVYL